jgi:hypothetical protein
MTKFILGSFLVMTAFLFACKGSETESKPIENISFEDVTLNAQGFYNGSDLKGEFKSGSATFPNSYNTNFNSWSGWSASSLTDTANRGALNFQNQYSVYAQSGGEGSTIFAVYYSLDSSEVKFSSPKTMLSCQIANSTYSYHDLINGTQFSKKFGDGDFFLLTITGYGANNQKTAQVQYYLADFRPAAPEKGVRVGWKTVNLAPLGTVSRLVFSLTSSDTSSFGMNNPAYFCLDNLKVR